MFSVNCLKVYRRVSHITDHWHTQNQFIIDWMMFWAIVKLHCAFSSFFSFSSLPSPHSVMGSIEYSRIPIKNMELKLLTCEIGALTILSTKLKRNEIKKKLRCPEQQQQAMTESSELQTHSLFFLCLPLSVCSTQLGNIRQDIAIESVSVHPRQWNGEWEYSSYFCCIGSPDMRAFIHPIHTHYNFKGITHVCSSTLSPAQSLTLLVHSLTRLMRWQ